MLHTKFNIGTHAGDETLEAYALGRLSEAQSAGLEEHLLICGACREELAELDGYIAAMKAALAKTDAEQTSNAGHIFRRISYIAAGALAATLAVGLFWQRSGSLAAEQVNLYAMRGAETPQIHANHPADLKMSVPDLPDGPYRVEVVDSKGRLIWSGSAASTEQQLNVREPKALKSGLYWVRLYSVSGTLVREFGLKSS
jgi:anti-sigma factor RsiW